MLDRHILHEIGPKNGEAACTPHPGEITRTVYHLSQRRAAGLILVHNEPLRYRSTRDLHGVIADRRNAS
jgi:hypothetical protein